MARVRRLVELGALSRADGNELKNTVRHAYQAFHEARAKLGDADYDGLREEFVQCRRYRHSYGTSWEFLGMSVGPGYGMTYKGVCEICGMVCYRYRKPNGMSNGAHYDPPDGYTLNGLSEQLSQADINALEAVNELESYVTLLEKSAKS